MLYKWTIKRTEDNFIIHSSSIEAENQSAAMELLNKQGISPHTGELLEIIEPMELTPSQDDRILS
ncbi:hypothetical protein LCGC14_1548340 [marine sediment metagenome]|uniref:Uncharacterized protein n=1 Tax=marine sediment metagenome TaxID=412755 RepID=A0A0F9L729_9ZZZZ